MLNRNGVGINFIDFLSFVSEKNMYNIKNELEKENGFEFNDDDIIVVKMEEHDGNDATFSHDPLETVEPSSDGRWTFYSKAYFFDCFFMEI